jgi:RNA polymerase sigma factor for flagellar operon FliA
MNTALQCYRQEKQRPTSPDRETMVQSYLPLVRRVAHRIARNLPASVDVNDLVSAGCIGLLSAVERFDPERGLDFGTFAEFRIKGAILDELRARDPVPRRSRHRIHQMEKLRRELIGILGRPPNDEEMAEHLGMELEDYHTLADSLTPCLELSLSLLDQGSGNNQMVDGGGHACPDAALQRKELRRRLVNSIRCLPERLRTVISLYYYARLSYKEISLLFEVTESRICQMHREAVNQIRTLLDNDEVGQNPE